MDHTLAAIDPDFRVRVPSSLHDPDLALDYWLANPLLQRKYPRKVAATLKIVPSLAAWEKTDLVRRLKKHIDALRYLIPYDAKAYNDLLALIRHELVEMEERNDLKPHLNRLRGAELEREHTRLAEAIKLREYAMYDAPQD
ncbi:hypothetical protein [Hymenobacter fodinae]|uniref:Uncharacterized protein n=1 Tax=Hymenobacter fodinae TaxID=2510796 RepID=A0A4Z0P7X5_9BACT|nr:hypothetical protein [Hymenobacter fodinae]TGE08279.1 hypothetical protein EU556_11195 [Hymenobacter fodinae]